MSSRGAQPLTLAWAHEEVMDVVMAGQELDAEIVDAMADGTVTDVEVGRIAAKAQKLSRQSLEATVAVGLAIVDDRKAENVRRGGVVSDNVLDEEAQLMAQADALKLEVPNGCQRNRRRTWSGKHRSTDAVTAHA